MLPLNIRVDKNCQPTWVTQNAIPREQELISLGGGHYDPPPDKVGLKTNIRKCARQLSDLPTVGYEPGICRIRESYSVQTEYSGGSFYHN